MKCESLSASTIKTYATCRFKNFLIKHLGLELGKTFAAENGKLVHDILEQFAIAVKEGKEKAPIHNSWYDQISKAYRQGKLWELSKKAINREKKCDSCSFHNNGKCFILDLDIDKFTGCPKDEFEQSIWLVEKVIKDRTSANPLTKKVIDVENKFKMILKSGNDIVPVNGIIDVVNELDQDTIEVNDYKTGNHTLSYEEHLKDAQTLIYNLAARYLYPQYKNIILTFWYLKGKQISLSFNKDDEERTKITLIHYWHKIRNDKSPTRIADRSNGTVQPTFICKYMCDWELCQTEYEKFKKQGLVIIE